MQDMPQYTNDSNVKQGYQDTVVLKFLVTELPEDIKHHPILHITETFVQTGENEIKFKKVETVDPYSGEPTKVEYTSVSKLGFGKQRKVKVEPLDEEDFELMVKSMGLKRTLNKTRCFATIAGNRLTRIDIYEDNLNGVCIAKIPFANKWETYNFVKPSWLGADITGDKRFKGGEMADNQSVRGN